MHSGFRVGPDQLMCMPFNRMLIQQCCKYMMHRAYPGRQGDEVDMAHSRQQPSPVLHVAQVLLSWYEKCMTPSGSQVGQDEQLLGGELAGLGVHEAQGPQPRAARAQQRRPAVKPHAQRVGHLVVCEPANLYFQGLALYCKVPPDPQQRRAAVEAHPQRVGHLVVCESAPQVISSQDLAPHAKRTPNILAT
jgi:hypothetical protein